MPITPHDMMLPPVDSQALVEATWDELGLKVHTMGPRLWVRTWRIPEKIGRIYIPDANRSIYKGLPHSKLVRATVLAVPRGSDLKVGDFVCFPQTFFARHAFMVDGTLTGFLNPKYLHGKITLEPSDFEALREVEEGRACAPS